MNLPKVYLLENQSLSMALVSLKLADFSNCQRGYLVLEEPIPASALDPEISQKVEILHFILDGGGKTLVDGAHAFGFTYAGGQILQVVAASEPGATSVIEITKHGVLSLPDSRAEADLSREWDVTVLPRSIIEVKQISTQSRSKKIDVFLVIQSAGICEKNDQ